MRSVYDKNKIKAEKLKEKSIKKGKPIVTATQKHSCSDCGYKVDRVYPVTDKNVICANCLFERYSKLKRAISDLL